MSDLREARLVGAIVGLVLIGCASGRGVEKAPAVEPNPAPPVSRVSTPSPSDESPPSAQKFSGYVYVEELPEAIERVSPEYPAAARENRIEGVVIVESLVGTDGKVTDTRIQKSIPELDQAAIDCVKRWRFKPAVSKGEPKAVWVAVPIRFELH